MIRGGRKRASLLIRVLGEKPEERPQIPEVSKHGDSLQLGERGNGQGPVVPMRMHARGRQR